MYQSIERKVKWKGRRMCDDRQQTTTEREGFLWLYQIQVQNMRGDAAAPDCCGCSRAVNGQCMVIIRASGSDLERTPQIHENIMHILQRHTVLSY
jgi:hypothetical protein